MNEISTTTAVPQEAPQWQEIAPFQFTIALFN